MSTGGIFLFGVKIYKFAADREWIVFIHGFGGNHHSWRFQKEAFSRCYNLLFINLHKQSGYKNQKEYIRYRKFKKFEKFKKFSKFRKFRKFREFREFRECPKLSVDNICKEIRTLLDRNNIACAHFISLSLGCMIALFFSSTHRKYILSLVMAGGIVKFGIKAGILLNLATILRKIIPYMLLYRIFANIILPRKNHKYSREIFVRLAENIGSEEFIRWIEFIPVLRRNAGCINMLNSLKPSIPVIFVMGSQDHIFLGTTKKHASGIPMAKVAVIDGCGHICNIEKHEVFNNIVLDFITRRKVQL